MTNASAVPQPSNLPGVASAENGQVVLDGPSGTALTMTPIAALATAQSLMAAVSIAEGQLFAGNDKPEA